MNTENTTAIETDPAPQYTKGFNEGYLLQQHRPELAEKLAQSLEHSQSDYALGFKDGTLQLEKDKAPGKEKEQEKTPDFEIPWLKPLPENLGDLNPGKEMDKDDYEPEKE